MSLSIFERKIVSKVHVDDTDILLPNIINSEFREGHTEYVLRVERGSSTNNRWYLHRRYNDFLSLHQSLQAASLSLPFPPKKFIGNLDRKFISERQLALQSYLDEIIKNPILSTSFPVKHFLDPANYKANLEESYTNELQVAIRNEMDVKIIKLLPQLGWRFRKKSFVVSLKENAKKEYLLQWVPFGPDKHLEDEELCSLLKSITSLQHANIANIEKSGLHRGGGWVLHDIKSGTLLDTICLVKDPLNSCALKKYANYSQRKSLDIAEIIEISSQVLQALAFLHHKGIPYGHLHLGNILLEGNLVKLYGIENTLFGLPMFYRQLLINMKQLDSLEAVDVYCFGLVLYEMLFVKSYNIATKEIHVSSECPVALRDVLESILLTKAVKNGLPSVKDLLNLQIFRRPPPNPQAYFKINQPAREHLDFITSKVMSRIKEDNSKVRELKKAKAMQRLLTETDALPALSKTTT